MSTFVPNGNQNPAPRLRLGVTEKEDDSTEKSKGQMELDPNGSPDAGWSDMPDYGPR